jgi:hypothetical protein
MRGRPGFSLTLIRATNLFFLQTTGRKTEEAEAGSAVRHSRQKPFYCM